MDEFEQFVTKPFVSRLLGRGDWETFVDKLQDVIPEDQQPEFIENIAKGQFTMRILYEQFQNILKMGPMSQVGFAHYIAELCAPYITDAACRTGLDWLLSNWGLF